MVVNGSFLLMALHAGIVGAFVGPNPAHFSAAALRGDSAVVPGRAHSRSFALSLR
jgi:hypothetical protein